MDRFIAEFDSLRGVGHSPFDATRRYTGQSDGFPAGVSPNNMPLNPARLLPVPGRNREDVQYVADGMKYGDFAHVSVTAPIVANGIPVLTRPGTKRTFLMIQNTDPVNPIFVGLDQPNPSATIGMIILAGGSVLFDACVPQNDVYVVAGVGAVVALFTYCNQGYGIV